MPVFEARVVITLKNGVLDPQGQASANALVGLGFPGIQSLRQGKVMDVVFDAASQDQASDHLIQMCEKLLANTVIEDFSIDRLNPKEDQR